MRLIVGYQSKQICEALETGPIIAAGTNQHSGIPFHVTTLPAGSTGYYLVWQQPHPLVDGCLACVGAFPTVESAVNHGVSGK